MTWKLETIPMLDLIEQHHKSLLERGGSIETARAYRSDLMMFYQYVSPLEMLEVHMTPDGFRRNAFEWLNAHRPPHGDWSARTTQRRLASLRSFTKFLGYSNVLNDYRPPTASPLKAHPLKGLRADVVTMLENCNTAEHRALIALCGLCGCRASEAVLVRVSHISWGDRSLHIYGKGAKERDVPISTAAWPHIARAAGDAVVRGEPDGRLVPIATRTARKIITQVGARAGLGAVSSHDLRMTFGTEVHDRHGLRVAQELLGHASSSTTEGYTLVGIATRRAAVEF